METKEKVVGSTELESVTSCVSIVRVNCSRLFYTDRRCQQASVSSGASLVIAQFDRKREQ